MNEICVYSNGGMMLCGENRGTRRYPPLSAPLDPPQVTQGVAWHRPRISAVRGKLTSRPGYGKTNSQGYGKLEEDWKIIHKIKEGASTDHVTYEPYMECTYNVSLWRVRVTSAVMETQ